VKLTMLKPRLSTVDTRRVAQTQATERIRGRALQTIRDRILRRDNGLCQCEECQASDFPLPASEVDHRVPLWKGGAESDDNRFSLNWRHHQAKTAKEAAERAGRTV
jgi:5-methylcytosine-specific restriction enzyme A